MAVRNAFLNQEFSPRERAAAYRGLALSIEQTAEFAATGPIRDSYVALARQWRDLADQLEKTAGKVTICLDDPDLASLLRQPDP